MVAFGGGEGQGGGGENRAHPLAWLTNPEDLSLWVSRSISGSFMAVSTVPQAGPHGGLLVCVQGHCQASLPSKPREELNPKTCPFLLEATNHNSKCALIFLKIVFEKCQARLNFKFKVPESYRFLYCPGFSNGKNCREVANENDTLIAVGTFLPGGSECYTCM